MECDHPYKSLGHFNNHCKCFWPWQHCNYCKHCSTCMKCGTPLLSKQVGVIKDREYKRRIANNEDLLGNKRK